MVSAFLYIWRCLEQLETKVDFDMHTQFLVDTKAIIRWLHAKLEWNAYTQ